MWKGSDYQSVTLDSGWIKLTLNRWPRALRWRYGCIRSYSEVREIIDRNYMVNSVDGIIFYTSWEYLHKMFCWGNSWYQIFSALLNSKYISDAVKWNWLMLCCSVGKATELFLHFRKHISDLTILIGTVCSVINTNNANWWYKKCQLVKVSIWTLHH